METAEPAPAARAKMKNGEGSEESEADEVVDSDSDSISGVSDDDDISKIRRAHLEQARAMARRGRRPGPRSRTANMSYKRKLEAVKTFHDFTKKLKQDTGIAIRSLKGSSVLGLDGILTSESEESSSDGVSEEEFEVNPQAVEELNAPDESYIDPETGDFVEVKKKVKPPSPPPSPPAPPPVVEPSPPEPKTLSISDIINDNDIDLSKNVEIDEIAGSEIVKSAEELMGLKEGELDAVGESSQDFDITEKLKEMGEISVKPVKKGLEGEQAEGSEGEKITETDEEKKGAAGAFNVRRNIREVMDEKQLDASTLAAQRQESERLARVQEQQRIIREVQRQIAMNRQNKAHARTMAFLQGGGSLLKKGQAGQKLNLPNTVLVKLASDAKKRQSQIELSKVPKVGASGTASPSLGPKLTKAEFKKEVVEIVDSSSSGEETSSSSSDSDDCIMLSDSEVPPSPEPDDDPGNSGLHVNDAYNIPDEQGRVVINIGHPENEEDIFLAPQIARIIKPHQIGGVRFLFDNIIESVERFSTSTGFGCILAHSMGLGKTLQIVCFCDIFLRHTTSKTVLCIMPINTLQNWVAEFNMWLPTDPSSSALAANGEVRPRNFPIYVLNDSHKTLAMRAKVVQEWKTTGGVLMIGYELYRLLSMKKDKKPRRKKKADPPVPTTKNGNKGDKSEKTEPGKEGDDTQGSSDNTTQSKPEAPSEGKVEPTPKVEDNAAVKLEEGEIRPEEAEEKKEDNQTDEEKKLLDDMYEALVKPGPDLVICDEGHRIKNSHSNISYALKQMRTKRRVVLTGYPLQNNLLEYWCMVDFVRPNYLGTKTEFSNMFERPIQNGQCIDSTPQDIRLMRYRAHVLHSLLVGFVQRRSHAVLQSTLPQKEEYVLLVRMTPLQRQLYDTFMNEVVRTKSVPNPLKAFAICCKIWNHPDVLYYFLKKRSETNAAIEEDLDLEEIGGTTKSRAAGRAAAAGRTRGRPGPKPRPRPDKKGATKKPAATIPPNTSSAPPKPNYPEGYGPQFPPYGPNPYGPSQYGQDQNTYPPYPGFQNQGQGYYPPPQEGFQQNYQGGNYYQQQPYGSNYPNQYPQNNPAQQYNSEYNSSNQNYWGSEGYYGQPYPGFNNQQFPNNQPPQDYQRNASGHPGYNGPQPYQQPFPGSAPTSFPGPPNTPYTNNQTPEQYAASQNRPPYTATPNPNFPNNQNYPYPPSQGQDQSGYPNGPSTPAFPPNNQPYPSSSYGSNSYDHYNPQTTAPPYPAFDANRPTPAYPNYSGNATSTTNTPLTGVDSTLPPPNPPSLDPLNNAGCTSKSDELVPYVAPNPPPANSNGSTSNSSAPATPALPLNYESQNVPNVPNQQESMSDTKFSGPYPTYPTRPTEEEMKPPLGSTEDSVPAWPLTRALKDEPDEKPNVAAVKEKTEIKSESDSEVKIEDLDTKKIVDIDGTEIKDENKKIGKEEVDNKEESIKTVKETTKSDDESDDESPKTSKKKIKDPIEGKGKKPDPKSKPKPKSAKSRAKSAKDRKTSKDKNEGSDSEVESEKEEKRDKEEEAALAKKAEEMTYDWATELLKEYIPGIIENSAKLELFFCILNESIKMGDRLLLFSQSLFTLNLIEDFLERNYIPGTNCLWERNTSYYRLDGSTSALEREKLINEFNVNPHVHLFLVSTRAGSLGINLVGANRVIVFDASWNPCHDTQAVCRVYRYGQKKPCFVYRFVMDYCLEKKIYDRQINKQGMADRVVDECNPDAVLSMKEITNLCWDNDEKEPEKKDLQQYKDKYSDVLMQKVIVDHSNTLSKEPFQHESLLVDRKEKKLSSAEKRLAQRGYELEKKAAAAPKPTTAYRTIRTADGTIIQRPVASVRPMQHGARWIPADVWRRQGMTAQEMTLPLDVVIPTNSAEKTNIVLKAGQRVMVLKSPKGIYMQLESGKIIAIKTSFKVGQKGAENKDTPVGKKILGARPQPVSLPGSLKNNSAITIIPKSGARPMQKIITRPQLMGQGKVRPMMLGHRPQEFRPRVLGPGQRPFSVMRKVPMPLPRGIRPNIAGLTIKPREVKTAKPDNDDEDSASGKMDVENSDGDAQVLDSGDDDKSEHSEERAEEKSVPASRQEERSESRSSDDNKPKPEESPPKPSQSEDNSSDATSFEKTESSSPKPSEPMSLLADEKLPAEGALEGRGEDKSSKTSLLKNFRRPPRAAPAESSLSRLERTACAVAAGGGAPDFRRTLDDITHSYSPAPEDRPGPKSRKKKPTPKKPDSGSDETSLETPPVGPKVAAPSYVPSPHPNPQIVPHPGLPSVPTPHAGPNGAHQTSHAGLPTSHALTSHGSHSTAHGARPVPHSTPPALHGALPTSHGSHPTSHVPHPTSHLASHLSHSASHLAHSDPHGAHAGAQGAHPGPHGSHSSVPQGYSGLAATSAAEPTPQPYGHYPAGYSGGYGAGYAAPPAPYFPGYGAGYYPPAPYPPYAAAPPPDPYLPPAPAAAPPTNHQW